LVLLPNREELALVLEQSINGLPDELKAQVKQIDTERVVNAALGLTAEFGRERARRPGAGTRPGPSRSAGGAPGSAPHRRSR
jgi:hypothetical protein